MDFPRNWDGFGSFSLIFFHLCYDETVYFWEKSGFFFQVLPRICLVHLVYHRVLQLTFQVSLCILLCIALGARVCTCACRERDSFKIASRRYLSI